MQDAQVLQMINSLGLEPWKDDYIGEKAGCLMPRLTSSRGMFIERCKVHIRLSVEAHTLVQRFTPEQVWVNRRRKVDVSWRENTGSPEDFMALWDKVRHECDVKSDRALLEAIVGRYRATDYITIDRCRKVVAGEEESMGLRNKQIYSFLR